MLSSSPTTSKCNPNLIFQLLIFSTKFTTKSGHMASDLLSSLLLQSLASAINAASLLVGHRVAGLGVWMCEQHFSLLYIPIHFMPGPLPHSLCALVWLLPVSGKDGKLQEGSKGACSVLCGLWWSRCSSLKQTMRVHRPQSDAVLGSPAPPVTVTGRQWTSLFLEQKNQDDKNSCLMEL